MSIKKVAVIGAGTMGAGIAGQAANAGCEVLLLDLKGEGDNKNAYAQAGLERISNPNNLGILSPDLAAKITVGNIEDDFDRLAECDWVAEAILERLDLKKNLYKKLDAVCKDSAIISSNTSTIPIKLLVEDMPLPFRERFAITHFFNPVRFMPLLELVAGEDTSPKIMAQLYSFCDERLGKSVVPCLDTPGFLGNRVGCYAIQSALHKAKEMGLSPQEADAVFGRPMGIPKTGVFGLYDLIGIDLMSDVASSLVSILPEGDAFHDVGKKLPLMETMIDVLSYAASLVPEVGETGTAIDDAMKLGYNWIKGPFELIDEIGTQYLINRLQSEQRVVPDFLSQAAGSSFYDGLKARKNGGGWEDIIRSEGALRFNDLRKTLTAVASNQDASWYDVDDIAVVEFHSKANALGAESMSILDAALDTVAQQSLEGLIVHNDAQHFSCGVNLNTVRRFFEAKDWDGLDGFLEDFQNTVHKMATADFPVVVAPVGLSLGGGFEVVLHSKQVICHANSNMGLVESGVGVIPAGGGCKETLYRWIEKKGGDVTAAAWEAFYSLGFGKTASSPLLAKDLAMLRGNDRFVNNRDRLFAESVAAIKNPKEQMLFERNPIAMAGRDVYAEMIAWAEAAHKKGTLFAHDVFVSTQIAEIVTGGNIDAGTLWTEQDIYDAERRAFLRLAKTPQTQEKCLSVIFLYLCQVRSSIQSIHDWMQQLWLILLITAKRKCL